MRSSRTIASVIVLAIIAVGLTSVAGWAQADVKLTKSDDPDPVAINQELTYTVTVENLSPQTPSESVVVTDTLPATVTLKSATASQGSCTQTDPVTCSLGTINAASSATIIIKVNPDSAGTITNSVSSTSTTADPDSNNNSNIEEDTEVTKRATETNLVCSDTPLTVNTPTVCAVEVVDISPGEKATFQGDTVTFSVTTGAGSFSSGSCTLDAGGFCTTEITYTALNADLNPHTLTANYGGSASHEASSDTFSQAIEKRRSLITLNCEQTTILINQTTTCTLLFHDNSTAGSAPATIPGDIALSDNAPSADSSAFSSTSIAADTCKGAGCSFTYTPQGGDAGNYVITATYTNPSSPLIYDDASDTVSVVINLRPTTTTVRCVSSIGNEEPTFVLEDATCTVTVTDVGQGTKVAPQGQLSLSVETARPTGTSLPTSCALTSGSGQSTCSNVTYKRTSLPVVDAIQDVIVASYVDNTGTQVHSSSENGWAQAVQRRETEIVPNNTDFCTQDVNSTCNVRVQETTANRGTGATPSGDIIVDNPDSATGCTGFTGTCSFNVTLDTFSQTVVMRYAPNDNIHLRAAATALIEVDATAVPGFTTPSGAFDVAQMVLDTSTTCRDMEIAGLVLDGIAVVVDAAPDIQIDFTGVTIPVSDIAAAILGGASIALSSANLALCTDRDGDGLFGSIENKLSLDDTKGDVDGDGLGDGAEIFTVNAGGKMTPGLDPEDANFVCPSPLEKDSDNDDLEDGNEAENILTGFCDPDTDKDGAATDTVTFQGNSVAKSDSYELQTLGTSPLDPDTDDDGLCDGNGTGTGCPTHPDTGLIRSEASAGTDSLDPDTDGDEILDGDEDLDGDGIYGLADTAGVGGFDNPFGYDAEPDPTIFDTDGDDLGDGFELGSGSGCDPSDPDTDDDDLSDSEEVNETHTTCSVADSDGDGLSDADEHLVISGTWPTRDLEQVTDPLIKDTDGDGRNDNLEYSGSQIGQGTGPGQPDTCVPGTAPADTGPGFANSFDSDDDGLNDGPDFALGADVGDAAGNGGELNDDSLASICDPDSDGDGLLDGEEHQIGTDPLDWDDDDDGLSDHEELNTYFTDPNNPDTDDDTADGNIDARNATDAPVLSGHSNAGTIACLSDCEEALSFSTQGNFVGNPLDETDPLQLDTDGDGIQDNVEFTPGCNTTGDTLNLTLADGFANSFDSDGDGASDGIEAGASAPGASLADFDLASAGDVPAAEGNDGELHDDDVASVCDPDSDGEGLLDGEEIGKGGAAAAQTGPDFRDWDTDDDGLSDEEELNTYFTDPTLADTDGDLADGVIDTRPAGFTTSAHPALTGYAGSDTIACLSDCEEVFSGTLLFNPDFSPDPDAPPAPGAAPGFGHPLDETDPLQQDTDGDGINDNIEFAPGCNDGPDGPGTGTALFDGFANSFDSDADGLRDFEDAVDDVFDGSGTVDQTPVTRDWGAGLTSVQGNLETPQPTPGGAKAASPDGLNDGEINDDGITGICDPDSDGDGILDGEEFQIGTDPYDWDSDDDGRSDAEFLGEGPIASDPFDFDTDDDGIGDGVEVFASSTTNPEVADTDGDGLCDGGAETPASGGVGTLTGGTPIDGAGTNPVCFTGVGDHPNPNGYGEDRNGDGNGSDIPTVFGDAFTEGCTPTPGSCETDPNNPDTDSDGLLDSIEALAYSTSRSTAFTDGRGRPSRGVYPDAANPPFEFSCLNPVDTDSDEDGLTDGFEDQNHDGNWDFLITDFDHFIDPLGGQEGTDPEETNPCDADSDDDSNPGSTNAFGAAGGNSSDAEERQRGTNPLDFDSDNDLIDDGVEVAYVCEAPQLEPIDNDNDGRFDEDPIDGVDNDGDGLIDEDPVDFTFITVTNLNPLARDSDSDGFIDGLENLNLNDSFERDSETNPCASPPIPLIFPIIQQPADTDGDGIADEDERAAGTDLNDPDSHPIAFIEVDLDLDGIEDDRLWLEDPTGDGIADWVAIDVNSNVQVDVRIEIIEPRDYATGDFNDDGSDDDCRYTIVYAFANQRGLQPRIVLSIDDLGCDLTIDRVSVERAQQ